MQYKEGQQVEVIDCINGHRLDIGAIIRIIKCNEDDICYIAEDKNINWWCVTDGELRAVDSFETNTRDLLQSILDNAVHIGGTDYRISEDLINKIREVLK